MTTPGPTPTRWAVPPLTVRLPLRLSVPLTSMVPVGSTRDVPVPVTRVLPTPMSILPVPVPVPLPPEVAGLCPTITPDAPVCVSVVPASVSLSRPGESVPASEIKTKPAVAVAPVSRLTVSCVPLSEAPAMTSEPNAAVAWSLTVITPAPPVSPTNVSNIVTRLEPLLVTVS